ncbi:MAG: GBS Bsp-like repeat-containing protein [Bacillota bacterium]|nr:GBS Bsp-like repeat-containing protein [Bacillota bacterium]
MIFKWKKGIFSTFLSISLLAPMLSPACMYAQEENLDLENIENVSELEEIVEDKDVFEPEKKLEEIKEVKVLEREKTSDAEVKIMMTVTDNLVLGNSKLIVKGSDEQEFELEDSEKEENDYTFKGSFEPGFYTIDTLILENEEKIDLTSLEKSFEVTLLEEEPEADEEENVEEPEEEESEEVVDTDGLVKEEEEEETFVEEEDVVLEDDERFLEEEIVVANEMMNYSQYLAKVNSFLNDPRWSNGTYWPQIQPKLSKSSGAGCYAYCLDFIAYVYGEYYSFELNPYYDYDLNQWVTGNFTPFYSVSQIGSGDIVGTGSHWFVVYAREGNTLYTCEGATGRYSPTSVVVSNDHYEIRNGQLYDLWNNAYLSFSQGYGYNYMPAGAGVVNPVDPPVISDVTVSDISATGYEVTCRVSSEAEIDRVTFPTWTDPNGQDDIQSNWENNPMAFGKKNADGTYSYHVDIADHNYEDDTNYNTHIYAFDVYGNGTSYALPTIFVPSGTERLEGYSVTLDGTIGVNFYMSFNHATLADEGAYMEFTLPNGSIERRLVKDATKHSTNDYYIFPVHVSAKDMTGSIKAKLVYSNGSVGKEYTYTVEEYANYILTHSSRFGEKDVKIAKAMLTYGRYVQLYFGHNTSQLPANVNALVTPDLSAFKAQVLDSNENLDFVGGRLTLTSSPELQLYFTSDSNFRVNGQSVSTVQEGKYFVVTISDITDMESMFTITADNFSMNYGIFSYGYQALTSSSNTNLQNLIKAMYAFDLTTH